MKQPWLALALTLAACGNDGGEPSADGDSSTSTTDDPSDGPSGGPSGTPSTTSTSNSASTDATTSTDDTGSTSGSSSDEGEDESSSDDDTGTPDDTLFTEDFAGPDGAAWPEPWEVVGDGVLASAIDGERGRIAGATMHTGRIILPDLAEVDSEVWATITFEDPSQQGFGFYVRQNGGALQDTDPPGLGYSVYLEGSFLRALGIWRETNGVEEALMETPDAVPGGLQPDVPYRVRFQCSQVSDLTSMRAKVWPADATEPDAWMVSVEDGTPELQDYAASYALDVYNYGGTGSIWIDDVVIARL